MTERISPEEELARRFHATYERLAPDFGYETRRESAVPWEQVPETNRRLMIAVCQAAAAEQQAEIERLEHEAERWQRLHDEIRAEHQVCADEIERLREGLTKAYDHLRFNAWMRDRNSDKRFRATEEVRALLSESEPADIAKGMK